MDQRLPGGMTTVSETAELWSESLNNNIGSLHRTALCTFLFTIYMANFKYITEICLLQKFSDDMAIIETMEMGREEEYSRLIGRFVV